NKQPHHDASERAGEMKAAMEKDERKAEKSQPQMAAHPGLRSSNSPNGKLLAQPQSPANSMKLNPTMPNVRPSALPPRGPCAERTLYNTYTAVATASPIMLPANHLR